MQGKSSLRGEVCMHTCHKDLFYTMEQFANTEYFQKGIEVSPYRTNNKGKEQDFVAVFRHH